MTDVVLITQKWKTGVGHGTFATNLLGLLPAAAEQHGINVSVVPVEPLFEVRVGGRKMGGFVTIWPVRYLKRPKAKIVHALDAYLATPNTQLITLLDLAPLKFPGLYLNTWSAKMEWGYRKKMLMKARALTSISQFSKKEANKILGIPPARIKVIPLGVNHQKFFADKTRIKWCRQGKINLITAGNNDLRKNFPLAVKAAGILQRMGKNVNLVRFGPSDWPQETERIRKTAMEWNVRITEPGVVGVDVLRKVYSTCDVFVWPSIYEGMGLPPLEAMACGAKVVALDTEFNREFLGDVPVYVKNDPKEMAEGILEALKMDIGTRGIEQARKFTWEKCVNQHILFYKTLLKEWF
ncbi:MAG: glycosyltransferase family 4 protein [Thermoplasmata archaeon]|nr:glycosyltransferase family 4 protein [Thermoplasmata archaeon]